MDNVRRVFLVALISREEGEYLVKLAREAVTKYLLEGERISPPDDVRPRLKEKRGVFVSIIKYVFNPKRGARERILRGCVGFPYPVMPLVDATIDAAIAASEDRRFPRLLPSELKEVIFEVTVLSEPEPITVSDPDEYLRLIRLGVDGLLLESGDHRAVVLPQQPVDYGWGTVEQVLEGLALKAGLPPDGWRYPGVRLYRFQADIYAEVDPEGEIIDRRPDLGARYFAERQRQQRWW